PGLPGGADAGSAARQPTAPGHARLPPGRGRVYFGRRRGDALLLPERGGEELSVHPDVWEAPAASVVRPGNPSPILMAPCGFLPSRTVVQACGSGMSLGSHVATRQMAGPCLPVYRALIDHIVSDGAPPPDETLARLARTAPARVAMIRDALARQDWLTLD